MRTIALRLLAVLALVCGAPASAAPDDHAGALAALADVRAAVTEIVRIEDGYAVGHGCSTRKAPRFGRPRSKVRKPTSSQRRTTCRARSAKRRWRITKPTSHARSPTSRSSSAGPRRTACSAESAVRSETRRSAFPPAFQVFRVARHRRTRRHMGSSRNGSSMSPSRGARRQPRSRTS